MEDIFFTPLYIELNTELNLTESVFVRCQSTGNGGAICAQNNCRNIFISKICSEECNATNYGQFLYAKINKDSYKIVITESSFGCSESSGTLGIESVANRIDINNCNFSFLEATFFPTFDSDISKNGCSISYTDIISNTCTSYAIFSVQEIESSGQNIIKNLNILNNTDISSMSIIYIIYNTKTLLQKCNIHNNNGDGFLILLLDADFQIEACSVQKTYGGRTDKICSKPTTIISIPQIEINIKAPEADECTVLKMHSDCKQSNKSKIRILRYSCLFLVLLTIKRT